MASATPYTLRLMCEPELESVVAIWTRSKKRALWWLAIERARTPEEDLAFFRDTLCARCEIWLAEREGRVVGLMALNGDHVDQLFIDPDAQGRGAGSTLLDHAKQLHPAGVWLFTHQRNERARAFYEARGFRAVAFGVSPPPECEPDVRYEWPPDV
jgi:ribosomal protein S18 acetylase RimI-like enzyme